jgi:lambda family phage minor tail protein L
LSATTSSSVSTYLEIDHYTGQAFTDASFDNTWYVWFGTGNKAGQMRQVSSFDVSATQITHSNAFVTAPTVGSWFRLAQILFLVGSNYDINYYLPGTSIAKVYTRFPIQREKITQNLSQQTEGIKLQISNVDQTIMDYLESNNNLSGNKVYMITTFIDPDTDQPYSGDSTSYVLDTYYIGKTAIPSYDIVTAELNPLYDVLGVTFPIRRYNREFCSWVYKGKKCGYHNGLGLNTVTYPRAVTTSCDHTLYGPNGCLAHTAEGLGIVSQSRRFGGFPGVPSGRLYAR